MTSSIHEEYLRILQHSAVVRQVRDRYKSCHPLTPELVLDYFPPREMLQWMIIALHDVVQRQQSQLVMFRASYQTNEAMEELRKTLDDWKPPAVEESRDG